MEEDVKVPTFGGMNRSRHLPFLSKKIYLAVIVLSLVLLALYLIPVFFKIRTVVDGRIYRSGQLSEYFLRKYIKENGIKTIINLRGGEGKNKSIWYSKEIEISKQFNIKYYTCRLTRNLPQYRILNKILNILHTAERPILIHCAAGVDRAGFISALALAIEEDPPLSELKKQFSWRYGAFPFYKAIGSRFFSNYEQWLGKIHKKHSRENLIYFSNHEYVDRQRNIEIEFDIMNYSIFSKQKYIIPRNSNTIRIEGWAIKAKAPVETIHVVIDKRTSIKVDERYNEPDVAKDLGLNDKFMAGFKVTLDKTAIGDGCHLVSFIITENDSSDSKSYAKFVFCFED